MTKLHGVEKGYSGSKTLVFGTNSGGSWTYKLYAEKNQVIKGMVKLTSSEREEGGEPRVTYGVGIYGTRVNCGEEEETKTLTCTKNETDYYCGY